MFNKKNILVVSAALALALLSINYIGTYELCNQNRDCAHILAGSLVILLVVIPFSLLSIITYFINEAIFKSWISFAKWWVPLTIVLTILTPEATGSAFVPFFARSDVAIGMSALFLVISLVIIIWKSWALRSKKA